MATTYRAFVVDKFGVIRVVDFDDENARVVDTCGDCDDVILYSCVNDSQLVGIVKTNGLIEIKNPRNPDVNVSFHKQLINLQANGIIAVMYLFNQSRQSCRFLTCTTKGKLTLSTVDLQVDSIPTTLDSWSLVEELKGEISFGDVNDAESICVFGGSDDLIMWDLANHARMMIFLPPKPPKNSPPSSSSSSFTCVSFFGKNSKIAAGTNNNEVRIYSSHQLRPELVFTYDTYPIKAISSDPKNINWIHVGNGCGKVASIDTRRGDREGKVHRSYVVKGRDPPGSIRSIARHPKLDIIASCGWDRYLRIWDYNSDQLLYEEDLGAHSSIVALFEAENPEENDVDNTTSKKEKKRKKSKSRKKRKKSKSEESKD